MAETHYVLTCEEAAKKPYLPMPLGHEGGIPDCTALVYEHDKDRGIYSTSHLHSDVPPEVRINIDYPEIEDRRGGKKQKLKWRLAEREHLRHLGWSDEDHRRHAFLTLAKEQAKPRGRNADRDAMLTMLRKDDGSPVTIEHLKDEAEFRRWGHDDDEVIKGKSKL
jgi:hypothetical protein